jgi:salicylate hydroxylase
MRILPNAGQTSTFGTWIPYIASDLPPLSVFHGQGVLLTGDAAHATTPHQGSGAGQAIEDALFLSNLLGHPSLIQGESISRDTIDGALRIYGEVRHERAARIQTTSAQAGLLYEGRGVGGEGQSLEKVAENLNERMRWIWEYDTEGELKRMMDRLTSSSAEKTR